MALRLCLIAVPVVALALLLEGALALAGVGYDTRFLVPGPQGLRDNYRFSWRFFPRSLARSPQPIWLAPGNKDGGAAATGGGKLRRYVVFGESAAMGDPEPAFGFPRMLQALLEQRFPGEEVEVVNTAMTAVDSHALRVIAREMAGVPVAGWIVYAGNNEVVGPFGPGTVFGTRAPPRWWVRAQLAAKSTRTGQWIQALGERRAAAARGPRTWRGMEMFLEARVAADDPALDRVHRSFERNLADIIGMARARGIPVVVGAAAANLGDSPPFAGRPGDDPAAAGSEDGMPSALRGGTESLSLAELRDRWMARPADAEAAWRLASVLAKESGAAGEAASLFRRACELDELRFRCTPALQEAPGEAARRGTGRRGTEKAGATLVEPQQHLDALSAGGVAGADFFYEHVHLTPRGAYELARLYAAALLPDAAGPWATLDECLERLGHTPWHQRRTEQEIQARLRRPPFSRQWGALERDAALSAEIQRLGAGITPARLKEWTAASRALCARHPRDWILRRQTAALAEAAGDAALAVSLLTEAADIMPHHTSDQLLGAALNRAGRPADAVRRLKAALAERPDFAQAWNSLGIALAQTDAPEAAEAAFAWAVETVPDYTEAWRHWAMVSMKRGATGRAIEKLRSAHAADPDDLAARNDLGRALIAAGHFAEAWPHYERVANALPGDANAQLNAALLLQKLDRPAEAAPWFERTLAIDPANPHALRALGK